MEAEIVPPPPQEYRDRKAGLVIFGVLTVLAGLFCWLMVAGVVFGLTLAAKEGKVQAGTASLGVMVPLYVAWGIALIWLGIGSMMARRWARALLLIYAWSWLIAGMTATAWAVFFMKRVVISSLAQASAAARRPPADPNVVYYTMLAFFAVFAVILPLIWVLFYQGRNVRATCEVRDPVPRWTDRCPLPVLGAALWLAFGAASTVLVSFGSFRFLPFFGTLLTGPAAAGGLILLALVTLYTAWELYRLRRRGWWILVALICMRAVSDVLTYARHDLAEIYQRLNFPPQTIESVQRLGLGSNWIMWSSVGGSILVLGYLIYLRKFFPRTDGSLSLGENPAA